MSKGSAEQKLKEEINQLKQQNKQVSTMALNYKDAAYNNEIILNRTLRFVTGKLLKLKKNPKAEDFDELIEYLNRSEDQQNVNEQTTN